MAAGQSGAGCAAKPIATWSIKRCRDWKRKAAKDADKQKILDLEWALHQWDQWWASWLSTRGHSDEDQGTRGCERDLKEVVGKDALANVTSELQAEANEPVGKDLQPLEPMNVDTPDPEEVEDAPTSPQDMLGTSFKVGSIRIPHENSKARGGMGDDFAATVIQRSFRRWKSIGPLGYVSRREWLLAKTLEFEGYEHAKSLVRRSAAAASDPSAFDPEADLRAIRANAAFHIRRAWRKFRATSFSGKASCAKRTSVMGALARMSKKSKIQLTSTSSTPAYAKTKKSRQTKGKKDNEYPFHDKEDDRALEEGMRVVQAEQLRLQAATTIQRAWRDLVAASRSDPCEYVPVMFGLTQQDLDDLSTGCHNVLSMAGMMTSVVSFKNGEYMALEVGKLGDCIQQFMDVDVHGERLRMNCHTFLDCLQHLFGFYPKSWDTSARITGALVAKWFHRYLAYLQKARRTEGKTVSDDHACIALACMCYTAQGHALPADMII